MLFSSHYSHLLEKSIALPVYNSFNKLYFFSKNREVKTIENSKNPEILLSRAKQHRGSVYCCGFNPTGELLATGSNDKSLRLMAFNSDECKIGRKKNKFF